MAELLSTLRPDLIDFIAAQKLFFVGTAAADGRVNISPKGMDSLRVIDERTLVWMNLTGSGNETAAHIRAVNRMTIMFCSFESKPLILRLYGQATALHPGDPDWPRWAARFVDTLGGRQIFVVDIDLVQTSCGYAVPFLDYRGERETLGKWYRKLGERGIEDYWRAKNMTSIDGLPTGMPTPTDEPIERR